MNILGWILMGLIAGAVAKAIMKEGGGWVSSLVTGVVGALVGGWVGSLLFDHGDISIFSIWSWVLAIGGSVIVIWLYNLVAKNRAHA